MECAKNTGRAEHEILVCAKDRQFGLNVTGGKCVLSWLRLPSLGRGSGRGMGKGKGKAPQRLRLQHAGWSLSGRDGYSRLC